MSVPEGIVVDADSGGARKEPKYIDIHRCAIDQLKANLHRQHTHPQSKGWTLETLPKAEGTLRVDRCQHHGTPYTLLLRCAARPSLSRYPFSRTKASTKNAHNIPRQHAACHDPEPRRSCCTQEGNGPQRRQQWYGQDRRQDLDWSEASPVSSVPECSIDKAHTYSG